MRSYILFFALAVVILGSCTTASKTTQTVDDVYYSPTRPQDEYVVVDKQPTEDRYYSGSQDYYTDRYMRMRLANPYRWSALDDYYFNNPYAYNYYGSYNNWYSPWNSYWGWNSYYNPYYVSPIFIKNPVRFTQVPSRATVFNPRSYLNTTPMNVSPAKSGSTRGGNSNMSYYNPSYNNGGGSTRYNNSNSSSRGSYSNGNSNSNSGRSNNYTPPSQSTPTRSYTPSSSSSSSSSSSGSSSSSSAPTRPPR